MTLGAALAAPHRASGLQETFVEDAADKEE